MVNQLLLEVRWKSVCISVKIVTKSVFRSLNFSSPLPSLFFLCLPFPLFPLLPLYPQFIFSSPSTSHFPLWLSSLSIADFLTSSSSLLLSQVHLTSLRFFFFSFVLLLSPHKPRSVGVYVLDRRKVR